MDRSKYAPAVVGGPTVSGIAVFVVLLLVKARWAWTVPDLFPGAVEEGLVAESVSWWTAMKLAILGAVLTGLGGSHTRRSTRGQQAPSDPAESSE